MIKHIQGIATIIPYYKGKAKIKTITGKSKIEILIAKKSIGVILKETKGSYLDFMGKNQWGQYLS